MIRESEITSKTSLELLNSLIGQQFRFVGGPALWEGMNADRVLVATSNNVISFNCDLVELSFEGLADEYNIVTIVAASEPDVSTSQNKGYIYLQHANEEIKSISIVEEEVLESSGVTKNWKFVSDVAWILTMETGSLVITKLNHHMESLKVDFVTNFDKFKIPRTESRFEENILTSLSVFRRTLSLEEASARL